MAAKKAAAKETPVPAPAPAPVVETVVETPAPAPAPVVETVVETVVDVQTVVVSENEAIEEAIAVVDQSIEGLDEGRDPEEVKALADAALLELAGKVGVDIKKQLQPEQKQTEVAEKLDRAFSASSGKPYIHHPKKHHQR
jgi:hypothetical protein